MNGSVEGALVALAIISGLTVLGTVIAAFVRKEGLPLGMKPIRMNVLYLFTMAALLLVFVALRGFDWLQSFVPNTPWWDGATFMGTLIAGLNVIFGLIAMLQALVNSVTNEPEDKPEPMVPKSVFLRGTARRTREGIDSTARCCSRAVSLAPALLSVAGAGVSAFRPVAERCRW